jgi:hypothetical protein
MGKMNVGELIEELKKYDPNLIVATDGYEGGVTDNVAVSVTTVGINDNEGMSCFGEHSTNFIPYGDAETAERLIIGRYTHK